MEPSDYEYRGMKAKYWDLLRGDTSAWEDRALYRRLIETYGQPALDVGCAMGRLLLDYLDAGIDIDGVDLSPDMIRLCGEKARERGLHPTLFQQPMEELALPRRYRTLLVPSSSFQLVLEPALANQALQRLVAHLEPRGALVMPFMTLWQEGEPLATEEWELVQQGVRPDDGALVRRWQRTRFDPTEGLEHTEDRYEIVQEGQVIASEHHLQSPATRSYTQAQARLLFQAAGLSDIRLLKGFSEEPATEDDRLFTVIGIKAAG